MSELSLTEIEQRISVVRQNINDLIEQAAAYSGGADEDRNADRLADQEQELARLVKLRKTLLSDMSRKS
jgi:predicted DNA-binding protein YlxM (UPF0122 family)